MHFFVQTRDRSTVTLTLNRTSRLNSYTLEHFAELKQAFERLAERDDIRVIVITGSGLSFCTGIDLEYLQRLQVQEDVRIYRQLLNLMRQFFLNLQRLPQFLIASINGSATGGGLNLALLCDWRIASTAASFGYPFSQLSLLPELGAHWLLPQTVGRGFAVQLALSTELVSARQAWDRGLVQELTKPENLEQRTSEMARRVAAGSPLLIRHLKRWLSDGSERSLREHLDQEIEDHVRNFLSNDLREGMSALAENRDPNYQGQ